MGNGQADAEPGIGRPARVLPAVQSAQIELVKAVGELENVEGVAHAIRAAQRDVVAGAFDRHRRAEIGIDLGVIVVEHQAPARP